LPRKIKGNKGIFIGDRTFIDSHSWIEAIQEYGDKKYLPLIKIGNDVQIGRYVTITSIDEISIGNGCLFSEYVYISDHAHDVCTKGHMPLVKMPLIKKGKVRIGAQCFFGFRSIIMPGVTLGDRCIVGAGAVVTKSFPSNSVLAGVPAKILRTI
jgi:acetyltransferase-like isoleucine patch superfamily enzyme